MTEKIALGTSRVDERALSNATFSAGISKPRLFAMQIDQEWLVTDVHNNHVVFGAEEISEVVNTLMGVPSR